MMLAQQLYEGIDIKKEGTVGLITYMRTDSTRISNTAKDEAYDLIESAYGKEFTGTQKSSNKAAAQDAHEAVRPTSANRTPDNMKQYLSRDQHRLYKLIWDRFIASQMAPAILDTVKIDLSNNGVLFRSTGQTIKFKGFMQIYIEGSDDEEDDLNSKLPEMNEGETVTSEKLSRPSTLRSRRRDLPKRVSLKRLKNRESDVRQHTHRQSIRFKNATMSAWTRSVLSRQKSVKL